MDETRFTQGPWHTDPSKDRCAVYDANDFPVCASFGANGPEQEANARLIAATPAMYRILQELLLQTKGKARPRWVIEAEAEAILSQAIGNKESGDE